MVKIKEKNERKPKRMVSLRMPEDMINLIEKRAAVEDRTQTSIVLRAIHAYLRTKPA